MRRLVMLGNIAYDVDASIELKIGFLSVLVGPGVLGPTRTSRRDLSDSEHWVDWSRRARSLPWRVAQFSGPFIS